MSDDNTTGHVWDVDLKEMNNPLPRWWMYLFVITVVFAGIYLALYPGLGKFPGTLGWSSTGQYKTEQQRAQEQIAQIFAKFNGKSAEELAKDSQAMGIGERLFGNNCAQCHGSDGRGSKGFPNLTDGDWQWGGTHADIIATITNGRVGVMPPMAAAVGTADDVRNLANYVLSLSGSAHNSAAAQMGKPKFAVCAACHGPEGKGMTALGAPNLTDKVWLHGWGEAAIVSIINNGKNNVMPAFGERLSAEQINVLAAYVLSMSQSSAVAAK
jgi:cytochrome c oxidase cbb3-type subunit 3